MKYGYEITIGFSDGNQYIALCVIKNIKDFDTMTESNQTMEHLALKLNIEHPLYIKSKEILVKEEHKDSLATIKADGLEPELQEFMFDLIKKMVKKNGRFND